MAYWALVIGTSLVAAEVAARIDDWIRLSVPMSKSSYSKDALVLRGPEGVRGQPHGRYKKWELNRFGFRGPEIDFEPSAGCVRVMILGASEAFGLYETEGNEFPSQLGRRLGGPGRPHEVINAAIAGMTAGSMAHYWEDWASRFKPRIVVIYASPLFYLNEASEPPRSAAPAPTSVRATPPPEFSSRFLGRVREAVELPAFAVRWRETRRLAALSSARGPDWFYRDVPCDRLRQYLADLDALTAAVRSRGAQPILLTHATRAAMPPRPEDIADLEAMRGILPRAPAGVIAAFEAVANREIRRLGTDRKVEVIDIAGVMSGRRDRFADLVHFNDLGASEIAAIVADRIREIEPKPAEIGRIDGDHPAPSGTPPAASNRGGSRGSG